MRGCLDGRGVGRDDTTSEGTVYLRNMGASVRTSGCLDGPMLRVWGSEFRARGFGFRGSGETEIVESRNVKVVRLDPELPKVHNRFISQNVFVD